MGIKGDTMMKNRIIPLLFLVLFVVACDRKNNPLTSDTTAIAVDPPPTQSVALGSSIPLKASATSAKGDVSINPTWSVENNMGTFNPPQGKETTFIAGASSGTCKIYATNGRIRGETTVAIGCPATGGSGNSGGGTGGTGNTGGTGGSGGGCGDCPNARYFGLFSETFIVPGLLLDTDSSRFANGGCIGVWPDGQQTVVEDGGLFGVTSEGMKSLKCTVGISGGWWLQFGSDDQQGLTVKDVMKSKDLSAFASGTLNFDVKTTKDVLIAIKWGDSEPLSSAYFTLRELGIPHDNQWHAVSIPISRFPGIDLRKVKVPASFSAAPGCINFTYYVDNVRWEK